MLFACGCGPSPSFFGHVYIKSSAGPVPVKRARLTFCNLLVAIIDTVVPHGLCVADGRSNGAVMKHYCKHSTSDKDGQGCRTRALYVPVVY